MERSHDELWAICKKLPTDFEPYGLRSRLIGGQIQSDCSGGCVWYHTLIGRARLNWGICVNPGSARAGLLTFEHQGCEQFEEEPDVDNAVATDPADASDLPVTDRRSAAASMDLTIDDELADGLAPLLSEHFGLDPHRAKRLADAVKEQGLWYLCDNLFVTSRASAFLPFVAAYSLCIVDVSEVLAVPVARLAELIEYAWVDLQLVNKGAYHVTIKDDGKPTIAYPESVTLVHPQSGAKHYAASLGGVVLETGLEHLQAEIRRRNLSAYPIPENLCEDDWRSFVSDRAVVTDDPIGYVSRLSVLCCGVIDISRVKDLSAPEVADRIYRSWVDLRLRGQSSFHLILWKEGEPTFSYAYDLDRIEN